MNITKFQNPVQESRRFFKRTIMCALIIICFFLLLLVRLGYLQLIKHHFYTTLSKRNIISIIPIKPMRGLIYDRNNVLVAKNISVYNLEIIPARIKNLQQTLKKLAQIIPITPEELKNFYHRLKQFHRYQPVPLKEQLTENQVDQFYVNQYYFPGVIIESDFIRQYPLGKTMSNVLGYVGRINATELNQLQNQHYSASDFIGKSGVEAANEAQLRGKTGVQEAEIDARGKIVRILSTTPPTPGQDIHLTIDSNLQAYAEKTLGDNSGAIVAIQPNTGAVLALATNPSYDPNPFVAGISHADYNALLQAKNHPLFNRATRGLYSPGSTIKPFIAFYALNNSIITSSDRIYDRGWFQVPNTTHIFHDWKRGGHGWVNVTRALTISCDTFFYQLANLLGVKKLDQALVNFGFGEPTGIGLPEERAGLVPTPVWKRAYKGQSWYTGDTILSGIGQGFLLATPLQLAQAVATFANHGTVIKPTLILTTQQPVVETEKITPIHQSLAWQTVANGMHNVIASREGTAWAFGRNASYSVAGKTGTAQVFGKNRDEEKNRTNIPKKLRNNHLFIAFAPIDHPKIAIAVVIEHTSFADHVARELLDYYFNVSHK